MAFFFSLCDDRKIQKPFKITTLFSSSSILPCTNKGSSYPNFCSEIGNWISEMLRKLLKHHLRQITLRIRIRNLRQVFWLLAILFLIGNNEFTSLMTTLCQSEREGKKNIPWNLSKHFIPRWNDHYEIPQERIQKWLFK